MWRPGSGSGLFLVLLVLLFSLPSLSLQSKLNARRVLLPYNSHIPSNYTLEVVDGGCYQWTSSNHEVATVVPVDPLGIDADGKPCSSKANVSAIDGAGKRRSTIVTAKSDESFKADVVLDVIKSIEIITTTRQLVLGDAAEVFEVQAKNDENNTFTCLSGIEFEWSFGGSSILRFQKFADSHYGVSPSIEYWEARNSHGHKVLIEGLTTGVAPVIARIADPAYRDVPPAEITLVVIANLRLFPSHDIILIPNSIIRYSVNLVSARQSQMLEMPSEQYYLTLTEQAVASLDAASSTVTALEEGTSTVVLKDKNIKAVSSLLEPSADIHVRNPKYLTLSISPGKNWALQEFTNYLLTVDIFDAHHRKFYPSENLVIDVSFPSLHFHVNSSTSNGTFHVFRTLKPGRTKIKAQLVGTRAPDGRIVRITPTPEPTEKDVEIFPVLTVTPPLILLPWDPDAQPSYTVFFKASGATKNYRWDSSDRGRAAVSYGDGVASATASVTTRGPGDSILKVTDVNNEVFASSARISVQPIAEIAVSSTILETTVGSSILLPVKLYGFEDEARTTIKKVFDDCSKIPLVVEIVETSRFTYVDEEAARKIPGIRGACRSLHFDCKAVGHSRIWIKYETPDKKISLKTTAVLGCHMPLKLVYPPAFSVLALGSSVDLTFEGGPRAWPMSKDNHYSRLSPEKVTMFKTSPIIDPYRYKKDLHVFRVVCSEIGESVIELSVGNLASATLPMPAVVKETTKLVCGAPTNLVLQPKLKTDESCPLATSSAVTGYSDRLPISSTRETEVDIIAKDRQDRAFLNISSLNLKWSVSDGSLIKLSEQHMKEDVNGVHGYRRWNRNYQTVVPTGKEGDLVVDVAVNGYRKDVMKQEGISSYEELKKELKDSLKFALVAKPTVTPIKTTVLNHLNNKVNVQISKGSGYFHLEPMSSESVNVSYSEMMKRIELTPIKDGDFTIKIRDICVLHTPSGPDATVVLTVVSAKEILLFLPEKIEAGIETDVEVQVVDASGNIVPASLHKSMNLYSVIASDIVSIRAKASQSRDSSLFTVKLGKTSVIARAGAPPSCPITECVCPNETCNCPEVKCDEAAPTVPYPSYSYVWNILSALAAFLVEYYQFLLTIASTLAVSYFGYQWVMRRSPGQSVPFIQAHHLNSSSSFASPTQSFVRTTSSDRTVSFSSPPTSPNVDRVQQPTSPRSPPSLREARPLWTVKNT